MNRREHIQVKHAIFYVPLKPSGNLQLAELRDGRYCIVLNDQIIEGQCWSSRQIAQACAAFLELQSGLSGQKAEQGAG